ncbi:hypothetical protein A9G13_02385 [Gilliamella sp. wkB178]|nr:hypothetical protein A9G13_02385 [Gilliamella apicola]
MSIKTRPKPSLKIKPMPSSLLFFTNKLNKIVVKFYQGDILLAMSGAEVNFCALEWEKCK